jgi:CheY-like chemotaxis protein
VRKHLILAAAGDPVVMAGLHQSLRQGGYDVVAAASAESALEWLRLHSPDLALLDTALPGRSGFDVCRRMRQDPRTARTPVIFLTTRERESRDAEQGKSAGSDQLLVTPVSAARLLRKVMSALQVSPPKKRILAVDDDPMVLEFLRLNLEPQGYTVITREGGAAALQWLASEVPDLVLLDASMPGGPSGFEVCRRIRQDPRTRNLPVIFLTMKKALADRAEARAAGSDLYLFKPLRTSNLIRLVKMYLSARGPFRKRPTEARQEATTP